MRREHVKAPSGMIRTLLVNPPRWISSGGADCFEGWDAGAGEGPAGEPGIDAGEVDGGAGEVVLQPGLGGAAVAGSAQAECLDTLGDGALDAGAVVAIATVPVVGVLLGAGPLKNLVLAFGRRVRLRPVPAVVQEVRRLQGPQWRSAKRTRVTGCRGGSGRLATKRWCGRRGRPPGAGPSRW